MATTKTKSTTTTSTAPSKKPKIKFNDDVQISVRSNVFGQLVYTNKKTGDSYTFERFGDSLTLTMGDLREMKGGQRAFFAENYIMLECIEDADYEDVEVQAVYESLGVLQYYKDELCPDDISTVFNWSPEEIKNKVPRMSNGVKLSIATRANSLIQEGILDSMRKIDALKEALGCELTDW